MPFSSSISFFVLPTMLIGPHVSGIAGSSFVIENVSTTSGFALFTTTGGWFCSLMNRPVTAPTGNPAQPSPPGSRINTRGFTILTRFIASDPRITGNATITINANFAADGNGPAWGTISVDIDGDAGTWDGTWQGLRVKEGTNIWVIPVHGSLKGNGGSVDGMVLRTLDTIYSYTLAVIAYEGDIEGRIIDPNSK